MQRFTHLFTTLGETNKTNEKVSALVDYFGSAPAEDACWALAYLIGKRSKRALSGTQLRAWVSDETGLPLWLVEECYDKVGDLAETIALLIRDTDTSIQLPLHRVVEDYILPLRALGEDEKRAKVTYLWQQLDSQQRFVWHKLIMGNFRVGVGRTLVVRALAEVSGIPKAVMAHRLMGDWTIDAESYQHLLESDHTDSDHTRPYPFYLAHPLPESPEELGSREKWQIEWKWDGIRAQLIHRSGDILVWTRGEELVTHAYPEIVEIGKSLPDGTVLDGELVAWAGDRPDTFNVLQKRIGRKRITPKLLSEAPVAFIVYDILELNGEDIRTLPLFERRDRLENVLHSLETTTSEPLPVFPSKLVDGKDWQKITHARDEARMHAAEGLMLKRLASPYGVGRVKGDWWKWKVDPYTIDAVLIYAQSGRGRRAGLYTDYTFGIWDDNKLVPIAKAYSGLTDEEIRKVDAFVRRNTVERFGPVRSVEPQLVFELAFEGIQPSTRHKSGIALRFPRMNRWRHDKQAADADTLATVQMLLLEHQGDSSS